MDAVNYTNFRDNLKTYCDNVSEGNAYIISRKSTQENVILLGIKEYNELLRAKANDDYRKKLDASFAQLRRGGGVEHDLIEEAED